MKNLNEKIWEFGFSTGLFSSCIKDKFTHFALKSQVKSSMEVPQYDVGSTTW